MSKHEQHHKSLPKFDSRPQRESSHESHAHEGGDLEAGESEEPEHFGLPSSRQAVRPRQTFIRDAQRWPVTGGYPPVSGGSGDAEDDPEEARAVFERYFSKTVKQWRKEGNRHFQQVLQEVSCMKRKHPEVYEEFLRSMGLEAEIESERHFRDFMEKHSARSSGNDS